MKVNHDIVTKGVSFNVLDPDQKDLLDHAMKRKNFSAYMKRLIQKDRDSAFVAVRQVRTEEIEEVKEETAFDSSLMNHLL